jgi:hypothetical protein
LEQILDKQLYFLFGNKHFFPGGVTQYILMGLDFTKDLKVSLCCLRDKILT